MSREFTKKLIEMMDDGLIPRETVVLACLNYMSESEVKEMMEMNGFIEEDENEES